jgi:hypothetical protein
MKKLHLKLKILSLILPCLILLSCHKEEYNKPPEILVKKELNKEEKLLKENLNKTALILSGLLKDKEVIGELKALSKKGRDTYNLSFKNLFSPTEKGTINSFKNLRDKFLESISTKGLNEGTNDLATFLVNNNCYIYSPYPDDYYPEGNLNYTIAAHPIDNEYEGIGYVIDESGKLKETIVNEKYTDENPVFLVMPNDKEGESEDLKEGIKNPKSKGDEINEVVVGLIRCASYCGGLFEGTLEIRIARGYPTYNSETEVVTGTFAAVIAIDYPKEYAKAAINNWTVHSNGGWYPVNIIWDSNWKEAKAQQGVIAYEYDQTSSVSVTLGVGYKKDSIPYSPTISATATTTYRGDFLGLNEWDRTWFYRTNTNPGQYDVVKDGWVARQTSTVFKFTTPARTL